MTSGKESSVLRDLRMLFDVGAIRELTDGQLLERFATDRGEAAELAFAVLVERHGPMVLRVCRSLLADPHDRQDAFQATFLVLIRRARGLWVRDSLGPWLYQVAYRTASSARSGAARRRRLERAAAVPVEEGRTGGDVELARVLHEEVARLPEAYRVAVILCDLEGCTHEQAARHLGWPVGTVKSRLTRARERLRGRLVRRGLAPTAALLAQALRSEGARAALPASLIDSTTAAAVRFAAARPSVLGPAAALAQGVLRAMSIARCCKVASVLLVLGASASGVVAVAQKGASGVGAPAAGKAKAERLERAGFTPVEPGKFKVTVDGRGVVEVVRAPEVYSGVEGQTIILSLVPEGTRVRKGELVAKLDESILRDRLTNQAITTKGAEAAYRNAKLAREVAESALTEFIDGTYQLMVQEAQGEIAVARSAIDKAGARLERARRARQRLDEVAKGRTPGSAEIMAQLDIDDRIADAEHDKLRGTLMLEQAQTKRDIFEKFTREKTLRGLRNEIERRKSDELARQAAWHLEQSKEEKLRKQVANCTITAPGDGVVVYSNDPNRLMSGPQIEVGATVRERQKLFTVADLGGPMRVNAKVPEAMVHAVKPGMKVQVEVDAFPGKLLAGTVAAVSRLPDPTSRLGEPRPHRYSTMVDLDDRLPGLRPGMSAQFEIVVAEHADALSVPVEAVVRFDDKAHLAVQDGKGGFTWREVVLGATNGRAVVIGRGLRSGERVSRNPLLLMSDDEKLDARPGPAPERAGAPR